MKRTALLLLACSNLSGAMPLHKGNTWTWKLRDWSVNYQTWRTATLIDSTPVDSGTSWHLLVRDSVTGRKDTATLLAKRDGSQHWKRTSAWFPWDPNPPTTSDLALIASYTTTEYVAQFGGDIYPSVMDSVVPWGGAYLQAGLYDGWTPSSDYQTGGQRLPDAEFGGCILFQTPLRSGIPTTIRWASFESDGSTDMPVQQWSDSLGLVRAEVRDHCDWNLLAFNGLPASLSSDSLRLPAVGDSMAWSESLSTASSTQPKQNIQRIRVWKVLGIEPQTGSSVKVRIEERVFDSNSAMVTDSLQIFLDPGMRNLDSLPFPARGWVPSLFDFSDDSGSNRIQGGTKFYWGTGMSGGSSQSNFRFDLHGNLVAYTAQGSYTDQTSVPINSGNFSTTIHRLDQNFLASVRGSHSKSSAPSNLHQLASLHPDLTVRWTDARGHHGQIPASSLSQHAPAKGVLFLEATLPDGAHWRGTSLPTR
jgi:hypothetical protein